MKAFRYFAIHAVGYVREIKIRELSIIIIFVVIPRYVGEARRVFYDFVWVLIYFEDGVKFGQLGQGDVVARAVINNPVTFITNVVHFTLRG